MKSFLKEIILFLLAPVTIFLVMELALRNVPNEYKAKKAYFSKKKKRIETLVLGSSHALRGIDPAYLDGCSYSMAMLSQPVQVDKDILLYYAGQLPKLKTVIVSVSYFSFYRSLDDGDIKARLPFYHFFYDLDVEGISKATFNYYSLVTAIGFPKTIQTLRESYLQHKSFQCDPNGYLGAVNNKSMTDEEFKSNAIKTVKRHEGPELLPGSVNDLEAILKHCQEKNIEVVLVKTPKAPEYYTRLNADKNQLINDKINDLIAKYPKAKYWDYEASSLFNRADFQNPDHLNKIGATKFTRLLNAALHK